jgi:hypothetical protein
MPPREIPLEATLDDIADELDEDDGLTPEQSHELLSLLASLPMSSPETKRLLARMGATGGG